MEFRHWPSVAGNITKERTAWQHVLPDRKMRPPMKQSRPIKPEPMKPLELTANLQEDAKPHHGDIIG